MAEILSAIEPSVRVAQVRHFDIVSIQVLDGHALEGELGQSVRNHPLDDLVFELPLRQAQLLQCSLYSG